jgi:hypothetical protein
MTDAVRLDYSNPSVVANPFAVYEAMHAKASVVRSERHDAASPSAASWRRRCCSRSWNVFPTSLRQRTRWWSSVGGRT